MTFNGDWDATLNLVNQSDLQDSINDEILQVLAIPQWRVRKLECTRGSIKAIFKLLPADTTNRYFTVLTNNLVTLNRAVSANAFKVTLADTIMIYATRIDYVVVFGDVDADIEMSQTGEKEKKMWILPVIILVLIVEGLMFFGMIIFSVYKCLKGPGHYRVTPARIRVTPARTKVRPARASVTLAKTNFTPVRTGVKPAR